MEQAFITLNKDNIEQEHICCAFSSKEAQSAPTPATIFSLFYNGKFITTDISVCLEKRFNKLFGQ